MNAPTSPTLGQQLHQLEALDKPVYPTSPAGDDADTLARRDVLRFFEDAKDLIKRSIAAGMRPAPFALGTTGRNSRSTGPAHTAMKAYSWHHDAKVVPPDNPYRDLWDEFVVWAQGEQLEVYFQSEHDGVGEHSWLNLCARADSLKLGPPPNLAEGTVVISKELLARFGSVQNYVDHLVAAGSAGARHSGQG